MKLSVVVLTMGNRPDELARAVRSALEQEHADVEVYRAMEREFARWDDIDVHYRGEVLTSGGHGFSAMSRRRLLEILQQRCRDLGATLHFCTEAPDVDELSADYDLVVAADGLNSAVRTKFADTFGPDLDVRACRVDDLARLHLAERPDGHLAHRFVLVRAHRLRESVGRGVRADLPEGPRGGAAHRWTLVLAQHAEEHVDVVRRLQVAERHDDRATHFGLSIVRQRRDARSQGHGPAPDPSAPRRLVPLGRVQRGGNVWVVAEFRAAQPDALDLAERSLVRRIGRAPARVGRALPIRAVRLPQPHEPAFGLAFHLKGLRLAHVSCS